jgi:RNA polymerase sigma factor (sigma-70 family)
VTGRSLQAVLRSLSDAAPAAGDGEFLRRFLQGDEDAFAELVRRHGRLVWAACRHLTRSDAEADDAFQATFLVLLKSAKKIRDPGRLSAWLHGVAYKVCAKARQSAKRRTTRERATAASEQNGSAVPDSAWDRALAAVHEEAAKLPETLRVPFVLCCLEGRGVTEAAGQLGWKLGTFSGRLTRAKDALLARLDARGLTLGAVAGVGLATPPATAIAKAAALAQVGSVVPNSILQLTQGVIGMSMKSFKVLAAAVLLTCGLGLGAGTGWVATADAQATLPPDKVEAEKRLQERLAALRQAELERARAEEAAKNTAEAAKQDEVRRQREAQRQRQLLDEIDALVAAAAQNNRGEAAAAKTAKWEYDFVAVSELTRAKFVEFLQDRENRGWEYNGTTKYLHDGKLADIWVFRRPAKGTVTGFLNDSLKKPGLPPGTTSFVPPVTDGGTVLLGGTKTKNEAAVIEAQIADLQAKLAELNKAKGTRPRAVFATKDLPLEPVEMMSLLGKLAEKKFGKDRYSLSASSHGVAVEGDKEVIDWFTATVKKFSDK